MARQVDRWTKQYRASETRRVEAMERLIAHLPASVPAQERTTIVHGDYKVDNVVFKPDVLEIAAVLDWELSTTGDPICDVAYLAMNWVNGPLSQMSDRAAQGFPEVAELVEIYCGVTGRAGLPDLNWYYAFNLFRLAAIIQGIVGRAKEGTANSAEAAGMESRVEPMAETAWRLLTAEKSAS
jgi:aminoglycoside phosphotransferase (APT) family kinase protein